VLSETAARWLLLLHTAVGVAAVGATTHLFLWLRRYVHGEHGRRRAVVRFAWLVLVLQLVAFLFGNIMYPTYKVEVRTAYLENASAVGGERGVHERELARIAEREHAAPAIGGATESMVRRAAAAAHWFDVKEHWIALGIFVQAALVLILALWEPKRDGSGISTIVLALAAIVGCTLWLGAIIGVMTAAVRAV
jgi:hypothetical protein